MESNFEGLKVMQAREPGSDLERVYQLLMVAIAECENVNFRQQNVDPDDWR